MTQAYIFETSYKPLSMQLNDSALIGLLATRDKSAYEMVFKTYFKPLHAYAFSIVKDEAAAEEMVQNIFLKLWERAGNLTIAGSLAAYLYRAVHNESLNYHKHNKVKAAYQLQVSYKRGNEPDASVKIGLKELETKLAVAMNDLPEQCRTIFQLSRFEELRYREIADKLQISIKTVENQMGKALRLLRERLVDYLPLLILLINLYKISL
ncbi:MAG TPA: RNA polymerase sigma-70 factor [Chitinophagaceae bacterium]|nr:RNA polymerase sigma-70 factor [Chitinophagaceae bacterium]